MSLTRRATDHALHEPVHRVQIGHGQLLALRHAQLPALVVQRTGELVERAVLDLLHLLRDCGLRRGGHARPVRREPGEAVLDASVVEAALPRAAYRSLHAPQVVLAPVVDGRSQPRLWRELLRVRVVTDPRDPDRFGELAGRGRVDVLAEHAGTRTVQALRGLLLLR